MKLEVSSRHVKLRAILTAVAFVIAVVAFTVGIVRMGHKDPGYHAIEAKVDKDTVLMNKAVTLKHWFDGSSNEIKRGINALTEVYTQVLSSAYKELDHQNSYLGVVNIATLNEGKGQTFSVSEQLYAVLRDAYGRTQEQRGYNMFAGALYSHWKSILILDEPSDFDPAYNSDEGRRIAAIAAMVSDLSNFSLEFLDDASCLVRFSVSDRYERFCSEYEIDAPALDLNLLKDAYMMSWIADALYAEGYGTGYLYNAEAQVLCLGSRGTLGYDMYTIADGEETVYATVDLEGPFSGTTFTAFGMGSYYHYVLSTVGSNASNDSNPYRHLYFNSKTGSFSDILMSATVISNDMDIVGDVYQTIILNTLNTEAEVEAYASMLEKDGKLVSYVFQSAGN